MKSQMADLFPHADSLVHRCEPHSSRPFSCVYANLKKKAGMREKGIRGLIF